MADVDDVVDKISQYKKYLDKYLAKSPEENKVLYVFKKLSRLAITVEYLQVTGIGKTVNGFRKHEGAIGDAARALVTKWKSLVTSEAPSIKCETVSTTNYHKAGTSSESIRAPYIDAPIRKAPYMEQTNLNNCVKRRSDNEASGESCGDDVNSSVDVSKVKQEKLERRPSSHENSRHVKRETANSMTHDRHGKHDRHRHGKHDHSGKHAESVKDIGMVKIKQEGGKEKTREPPKVRAESPHKPHGHTRTSAVDLGTVKREKIDVEFTDDELPNLECQQDVKTEKEDLTSLNHTQMCVDLGRVKQEADKGNCTPVSSFFMPAKSVTSDRPKCQSNVDGNRIEHKDKHHKQSKEKHGHRSDRGSSEKSHENKISDNAIGDSHKNKGHGSHHKSTTTKTRKCKSHEMSDSDDNGNDDSHDRQKEGELEDEKAERFRNINHAKLKHTRTMEGEDSPDNVPDDADEVDNGGMSFDDFLNYDASMMKPTKKNKKTHPAEVYKKTVSPEKKKKEERRSQSSSAHSKHKQDKSKHSSDKHRSKVKGGSSSGSRSKDGGKTEKRRFAEEFAVPEPKKQVKLTSEDILSTLPETNPNYRPLPQFRPDSPTRHGGGNFNTELIGSKTHTRTQVYSGRRQVFLSAVPTLFDACMKVLIDNIDALDYVGGVPYDILQPVLEKCTPDQLYHLEDCNPAFLSDTDVLWEHHCHQEFKKAKPDEFESWRELYLKLCDEREAKLKSLTARISASMAKKAEPVRKTRLAYVDVAAKPPREVRRSQARHGTAGPTVGLDPLYKLSSHGGIRAPRAPIQHTDPTASQQRRVTKTVAPMMAKSLKLMKGWRRN